jgi:hypothetical protein
VSSASPATDAGPQHARLAAAPRDRTLGGPLVLPRRWAWLGGRPLTLATGLAAAVPVIASTVKALRDGWLPSADMGVVATRAWDVLTSHSPLVGQYSYAGRVTGKVTHSLGPMLYWLLALPAHFGSAASITLTVAAVNTLAILGVVALARRRGGVVLMFGAAIALALMCQSLAAETFHDIWNPSAALFPFTLLIFLCWSVACGEYRLLPLTALAASFVVQANLTYLPPTIGLVAVALGGLALSRLRPGSRGSAAPGARARGSSPAPGAAAQVHGGAPPGSASGRRSLLLWGAATLAVLAFCWSAPVIEQLTERQGNISLVVQTATTPKATLGPSVGWHAVVRAVGVRPWWLYTPIDRWRRQYDVREASAAHAVISCVLLLVALMVVTVVGAMRGRRDLAAGALIGLVLCAALGAVAASTPSASSVTLTLAYTMWWGSQVGMWVWLMLAWSGWLALGWARRRWAGGGAGAGAAGRLDGTGGAHAGVDAPVYRAVLACIAALAVTAGVSAAVAAAEKPDEHVAVYRPTASLVSSLDRAIPSGSTVNLLSSLDYSTTVIKPSIRYFLARHGVRALSAGSKVRIGEWYELGSRPYQYLVWLYHGVRPPARAARLLDSVRVLDDRGVHVVSAWIAPRSAVARTPARPPATQRRRPAGPAYSRSHG